MQEKVFIVIGENRIVAVYKTQIQAIMRTYRENQLLLQKDHYLKKEELNNIWNSVQQQCNSDYPFYWQSFNLE